MTLAEYDASVGDKNRHFHECAESVRLSKENVLPLDPDDAEKPLDDSGETKIEPPETHGRDSTF